jgi:enterochelin esterase-like enzyme
VTLYSEALNETRRLVIYTPPGHDPDAGDYPVLLVADGGKVSYYGRQIDVWIAQGRIAPMIMIGLVSGREGIVEETEDGVDYRNADYLPDFLEPRERFDRHLTFAAQEVLAFARERYGVSTDRNKVGVNGRSSGGGFAYHAGVRRPDVFGHALVHSPGATVPGDPPPASDAAARFHIVAGRYETSFVASARRAAAALEARGYQVELTELSAGHTMEVTQVTWRPHWSACSQAPPHGSLRIDPRRAPTRRPATASSLARRSGSRWSGAVRMA